MGQTQNGRNENPVSINTRADCAESQSGVVEGYAIGIAPMVGARTDSGLSWEVTLWPCIAYAGIMQWHGACSEGWVATRTQ